MADMDELTPEQIEELHEDLLALKVTLEEALAATHEGAKPVEADEPIGRISRGDAMQQQQMARASRASTQGRLGQIARALVDCREGSYGLCRGCEEPIGYARLKARPETPFCLDCQSEREAR